MNEQTQQLIEKLAEKLGTTAEHVWAVLVRQAPLSSATDAIALCIYAAVMVWGYRMVREKTKDDGDWNDNCGSIALPWIIWGAGMLFLHISEIVRASRPAVAKSRSHSMSDSTCIGG